ncbi:hypothetical protein ACFUCV_03750 [Specibacter sp. NPDC057265]|uniref:hypothetical protein n=1 Tax=Specibacter sp. NPDC057265 TaxID=3346075 RepID=UPI00363AF054
MSESAQPRPTVLRRVQLSTAAWQLLCQSTSDTLALPQDTAEGAEAALDGATTKAAWAELQALGMSPHPGEVKRQWTGAVALLLTAPIKVTARATYNGVSTTSVLGLRAGRGLAAHQRHISEQAGAQTVITGSEDSMEITLFDEEKLWGATARLLPPLAAVRAGAKAAPLNSRPGTEIGAGATPAQAAALTAGEEANITLSVTAAAPGLPERLWAGMWSVRGGQLFSITTGTAADPAVRLSEVPPGHIANELLFAVVGAHEALSGAGQGAGEGGAL